MSNTETALDKSIANSPVKLLEQIVIQNIAVHEPNLRI